MRIAIPISDDRLGYFAWALENFDPTRALAENIYASRSRFVIERIADTIVDEYRSELYPDGGRGWRTLLRGRGKGFGGPGERYVDLIGLKRPSPSLSRPEASYSADEAGSNSVPIGTLDNAAYQAMLAGFLGTMNGDYFALEWLSVLMLRGPVNRQVTISRFLFLSTYGQIGSTEPLIPQRTDVLRWAQVSASQRYDIESGLPQMVERYARAGPA